MKIVIDPGHGGKDPGALGSYSKEKDINLILALKIRDKLAINGIDVICTRKDDSFIGLQERCNIANNYQADYFISIHCNSSSDKNARGTEIFCFAQGGKAYPLAQVLQEAMIDFNKNKDRGVKTANFHVLRETYMPAVLIETMFISNLQEEERLNDLQWQEDFTTHLSKIIPNYLGYERVREEEEKHYAQDAFDMWKEKGIVFEDHDLNVPITWGEYVITQHRLRNIE